MRVESPAGKQLNWTRKEIAYWCLDQLKSDDPVIIGIDHGVFFSHELHEAIPDRQLGSIS